MTDRKQLEALRDRLAKATGPDRMLDIAMHRWLFPARYEPTPLKPGECYPPDGFGTDPLSMAMSGAPAYTGNTDAALTLAPSECRSYVMGKGRRRPDEPAFGAMFFSDDPGAHEIAAGESDANIAICVCLARVEYELDKMEPA